MICGGGFYDDPEALKTISEVKQIWNSQKSYTTEEIAEVLLVFDPESAYYMRGENNDWEAEFNKKLRNKLNRMGAPFRVCSFNDIPYLEYLNRIKLVILPNIFAVDDMKLEILKNNLMKYDRTILFAYAPGIIKNGKWNESNVKEICAFDYKTPGLNITNMEGWNSAYIYDPAELKISDIRSLASKAGVHLYSTENVPVFANSRLTTVHCGEPVDNFIIRFPKKHARITELFSAKEFFIH